MDELLPLRNFFLLFGLCTVRTLAAVSVTPFMSSQLITGIGRNAIVMSWSMIVYVYVEPTAPEEMGGLLFLIAVLVKEVILVILIGFFASKIFWVAMSVGFFIDNQRGATLAQIFDPNSGDQTSPFGILMVNTLLCLFFAGGGFLIFLAGIFESYRVWPVFDYFPNFPETFPTLLLGEVDSFLRLVVQLAAPIVIIVFLTEFGLGLVNRFAPQLNVFVLAFSLKSLAAIFVLVLYIPFLFNGLAAPFDTIEKLVRALAEG